MLLAPAAWFSLHGPDLTDLPEPSPDSGGQISADQVAQLMKDAKRCFFMMTAAGGIFPSIIGRTAHPRFEYIAAALAIVRGYYRKQTGAPNFCSAARGCGRPTDNPRLVSDWVRRLESLTKHLRSVRADGEMALQSWQDDARRREECYEKGVSGEVRKRGRPVDPNSARQLRELRKRTNKRTRELQAEIAARKEAREAAEREAAE